MCMYVCVCIYIYIMYIYTNIYKIYIVYHSLFWPVFSIYVPTSTPIVLDYRALLQCLMGLFLQGSILTSWEFKRLLSETLMLEGRF